MARDDGGLAKVVSASMPPPPGFTIFTRVLEICFLVVAMIWVFGYLGGIGFAPVVKGDNANDPSTIFNWHPLFMALAFPICMAEAVLAYRAPIASAADRSCIPLLLPDDNWKLPPTFWLCFSHELAMKQPELPCHPNIPPCAQAFDFPSIFHNSLQLLAWQLMFAAIHGIAQSFPCNCWAYSANIMCCDKYK